MVFDFIIVDFDFSLPVGDKFSSQMIAEPSIGYWVQIGSSSEHFIIFTYGMLEFGRSRLVGVFVVASFD